MSTNDYQHSAVDYALRGVTGTDALAFRLVSQRVTSQRLAGSAIDLGCGAGRSTRFLTALGFEPVGVDVSEAMVAEARRIDPEGCYQSTTVDAPLPFGDASFDLLLSTWVVLEIDSEDRLSKFACQAARVLRAGGTAFIVANTPEFYAGRWVSCEVDFLENRAPLQSGQRVKARLMPERVVVTDTYWSDDAYRAAFAQAGLGVAHAWRPTAPPTEEGWLDETRIAPWVVYELRW